MTTEGTGRWDIYNHYVALRPEQRRNRVQAAKSFPWFGPDLRDDWRLRQSVDCGDPLLPGLAARYQARPRTIRYFQKFNPRQAREQSRASLIKNIDNYMVDYYPATTEDHEAFMGISGAIDDLCTMLQVPHAQLARPFVNGWKAGIEKLESQLGRALNLDLIFDMAQASFYYGVKPALKKAGFDPEKLTHPPEKWFHCWFGRCGLKRLLEMACLWERAYDRFSLKRLGFSDGESGGQYGWPRLLPDTYSHGPYRVVELASQHELETEGRKLQHCIASYGIKCLVSGSFIYALRDRLGNHISTFEIQFEMGRPVLQQHKGMLNQDPQVSEARAAERFIKRVLAPVSPVHLNEVRRARLLIESKMRGLLREPDSCEAELSQEEKDELASMLEFTHPAEARGSGIARYLRDTGIFGDAGAANRVENTIDCELPFRLV